MTVAGSVDEDDSFHYSCITLSHVSVCAVLIIIYNIKQIFKWHLSISNNELLITLEQNNLDIEQLSGPLFEVGLDVVGSTYFVGVNRVHGHFKVIQSVVLIRSNIASDVVTFKNFIFVERE